MTFNLTWAQFDAKRQQLNQHGINITGIAGTVTNSGVTLAYDYREPVLSLSIVNKPFFYPDSAIWSRVTEWFGE